MGHHRCFKYLTQPTANILDNILSHDNRSVAERVGLDVTGKVNALRAGKTRNENRIGTSVGKVVRKNKHCRLATGSRHSLIGL